MQVTKNKRLSIDELESIFSKAISEKVNEDVTVKITGIEPRQMYLSGLNLIIKITGT